VSRFPFSFPLDAIREFCNKHSIRKMWLFGSAAAGELRPDSDIACWWDLKKVELPGGRSLP